MILEGSIQKPSAIFLQALHEDSNCEADWLWYAEQITSPAEYAYCLRRALYIDPRNDELRNQLARL
jgi:hypothetical protein